MEEQKFKDTGCPDTRVPESVPDTSVIVAVYNNFKWLRLILDAFGMQTESDFEVIIADDGSSPETVEAISRYIESHPNLRIKHVWQPDEGWRKNKCLNKAVRASSGHYLIFIDGDCIPHPRFVADHKQLRRHGTVTGGRRIESGPALNALVESWETLPADYFSLVRKEIVRSIGSEGLGSALAQLKRSWRFPRIFGHHLGIKEQGILGANFGIYREDLEKVNGFDERYIDPGTGEDTDLDLRLQNAGIRHVKASHYALMIHRCHARLFWGAENNARLLEEAKANHTTYVATGLNTPSQNNAAETEV